MGTTDLGTWVFPLPSALSLPLSTGLSFCLPTCFPTDQRLFLRTFRQRRIVYHPDPVDNFALAGFRPAAETQQRVPQPDRDRPSDPGILQSPDDLWRHVLGTHDRDPTVVLWLVVPCPTLPARRCGPNHGPVERPCRLVQAGGHDDECPLCPRDALSFFSRTAAEFDLVPHWDCGRRRQLFALQ